MQEQFFESLGLPGDINNLPKNDEYFTVGANEHPCPEPTNIELGRWDSFNPIATFNQQLNKRDLDTSQQMR